MSSKRELKFGRRLASGEKRERDRAIKKLRTFLQKKEQFDDLELAKLWKGLYFCFWLSDKQQVQQELADRLSQLVHVLPGDRGIDFLRGFYACMGREWCTIDRHRIDKFYSLLRKFLYEAFCYMQAHDWDSEVIRKVHEVFVEDTGPLGLGPDAGLKAGVTLHFLDSFLPEFSRCAANGKTKPTPSTAVEILEPIFHVMGSTMEPHIFKRVRSSVCKPIIDLATKDKGDADEAEETSRNDDGAAELQRVDGACLFDVRQMADRIFEIASTESTPEKFRGELYELHTSLEKIAPATEKDFFSEETPKKRKKDRKEKTSKKRRIEAEEPALEDPVTPPTRSVPKKLKAGSDDVQDARTPVSKRLRAAAPAPSPAEVSSPGTDASDTDFVPVDADDLDDETTMLEAEAEEDAISRAAELAALQEGLEIPMEDLIAMYREARMADGENDDEASGGESTDGQHEPVAPASVGSSVHKGPKESKVESREERRRRREAAKGVDPTPTIPHPPTSPAVSVSSAGGLSTGSSGDDTDYVAGDTEVDDEDTLAEADLAESVADRQAEIDDLQKMQDLPIEELIRIHQAMLAEEASEGTLPPALDEEAGSPHPEVTPTKPKKARGSKEKSAKRDDADVVVDDGDVADTEQTPRPKKKSKSPKQESVKTPKPSPLTANGSSRTPRKVKFCSKADVAPFVRKKPVQRLYAARQRRLSVTPEKTPEGSRISRSPRFPVTRSRTASTKNTQKVVALNTQRNIKP